MSARTNFFDMMKIKFERGAWLSRCLLTLSCLYLVVNVCNAQFSENFSDGEFTSNPIWTPDQPSHWTIVDGQIRSNATTASSQFYISTPSSAAVNTQWEFDVTLLFNTSGANFVDVFLMSDQANLASASISGYFVRIGGTPDEISLYRIIAGTPVVLINGTDGVTNNASSSLHIKVIRDQAGWHLWRAAQGSSNEVLEGESADATLSTSSFFGIRITQSTASFFSKHYFDNLYAGEIIHDTTPPEVVSATPVSPTSLIVMFNEKLDKASAEAKQHYRLEPGGEPVSAVLNPDLISVVLSFPQTFPDVTTCRLTVDSVADLSRNWLRQGSTSFYFFDPVAAQPKDIVITEIFADPAPVIALPDAEYMELHNRSPHAFDLRNWTITDGSSMAALPAFILKPRQYVVLTNAANANLFAVPTLGLGNFPTLNNATDHLTLVSPGSDTIDQVMYDDAWYRDDDKKQGGWSLELIDTENICEEAANWQASEDIRGGTPGEENSVAASNPDITGPRLLDAVPHATNRIALVFDEKLEASVPGTEAITIEPAIPIVSVKFTDITLRVLELVLQGTMDSAMVYRISVTGISDCAGNAVQTNASAVVTGLPKKPKPADVVINEVLFNPPPLGGDFVEIYNRSGAFVNLKGWLMGHYDLSAATLVDAKMMFEQDFLLAPGEYLVLVNDAKVFHSQYPQRNPRLAEVILPSLPDDQGSLAIAFDEAVIDYFSYESTFHSPFVKNPEGVSLERISPDEITNNPFNWQSASEASGFATPGEVNSNKRSLPSQVSAVRIDPEIIEPGSNATPSAHIHYDFEKGGFIGNVIIYDGEGRQVKEVARQTLLGAKGFFRWDGDRDDGSRASLGYYLVWFEVFDATGAVHTYRKRVIVAQR
jgi:hypothetical protein